MPSLVPCAGRFAPGLGADCIVACQPQDGGQRTGLHVVARQIEAAKSRLDELQHRRPLERQQALRNNVPRVVREHLQPVYAEALKRKAALSDEEITKLLFCCDEPCPADVAMVFGAANELDLGRRTIRGVELYRSGLVPKLLVTGGGVLARTRPEAKRMAEIARELGVPVFSIARLDDIVPHDGFEAPEILRLAASLERGSEHPLAAALVHGAAERGVTLEIYEMMVLGYSAVRPRPKFLRPLSEMVHYDACGEADFRTDAEVREFLRKTRRWNIATERRKADKTPG